MPPKPDKGVKFLRVENGSLEGVRLFRNKEDAKKAHIELADRQIEEETKIFNKRCHFRRQIYRKLDEC